VQPTDVGTSEIMKELIFEMILRSL